jgi:RNA polymerase sigma-70 factor (ECF subfamily)
MDMNGGGRTGGGNTHREESDEMLVRRTLEDVGAYRLLVDRYAPRLMRYVVRLIRVDRMTAEDIVQDVFIKTYRNLNDFDPDLKFSSWVYRIAHNEAVSYLRKRSARPQAVRIVEPEDGAADDKFVADLNVEHEVATKLDRERVSKAIADLDPKYRDILILRYFEDKDYQEISDIIKRPMGTVATLLYRAKRELKDRLERDAAHNAS